MTDGIRTSDPEAPEAAPDAPPERARDDGVDAGRVPDLAPPMGGPAADDWGGPGEPVFEPQAPAPPDAAQPTDTPAEPEPLVEPSADDWGGPGEPVFEPQPPPPPEAGQPTDTPAQREPVVEPSADDWGGPGEPVFEPQDAAPEGRSALQPAAPEGRSAPQPAAPEPPAPEPPAPEPPAPEPASSARPEADEAVTMPPAAPPPVPVGPVPATQAAARPAAPRTVGRMVADALRAAGVRYAFCVPGESFLGLLDGLRDAGIRIVPTRHEGAAAFMAEAYGQLTGRPAACLGTRAVGAANLAIGIHTARQNSTPLFALVGQVERRLQGREAFQEIDLVGSIGRLALWSAEPASAEDAATAVAESIRRALGGRPGPVVLSFAEDLLDDEAPSSLNVDATRPSLPRPDVAEVRAVLQLLASAERPVILAGGGVLHARTSSDLTRLAELLHVPVIAAWRRYDVMNNEHPLFLGSAGYGSPAIVRERLERADALLVIGCRINEPTSFDYRVPPKSAPWAHVDLEPRSAAPGLRDPDIAVRSDARAFIRAAVQRLRGAVLHAGLVEARDANNEADRAAWEAATVVDEEPWTGPGVHPGKVVATLRRVLPDEAILTTDAGNFSGWTARGFRFRRPGTFLGPTSGAMGYGLPAAVAASLVHPDRTVVALVGDGGLAMTMAELETAVRERARPIVLVFDNERYGTIGMHQRRRGGEAHGTDLGPIDFAAIARACGARGMRVDADDAFEPALRQALVGDRPTVIQLALDRAWVSVDRPPSQAR